MLRPLRPLTLQWLYRGFNQRWSQHQALISKLVVSFRLLSKDRVLNSWTELSFSEGFLSGIQYSNDNIWQPIAFRSAKWARKDEFNECTQNSLIPPSHLTSSCCNLISVQTTLNKPSMRLQQWLWVVCARWSSWVQDFVDTFVGLS